MKLKNPLQQTDIEVKKFRGNMYYREKGKPKAKWKLLTKLPK